MIISMRAASTAVRPMSPHSRARKRAIVMDCATQAPSTSRSGSCPNGAFPDALNGAHLCCRITAQRARKIRRARSSKQEPRVSLWYAAAQRCAAPPFGRFGGATQLPPPPRRRRRAIHTAQRSLTTSAARTLAAQSSAARRRRACRSAPAPGARARRGRGRRSRPGGSVCSRRRRR